MPWVPLVICIFQTNQVFLCLLAAIPLIGIGWYQIEIEMQLARIGSYLGNILIPRIRILTAQVEGGKTSLQYEVLEWESYKRWITYGSVQALLMAIVALGRFGLAVLPGIFLISVFVYQIKIIASRPWLVTEIALLLFDLFALVYAMLAGILAATKYRVVKAKAQYKKSVSSKDTDS